jgi:hypothetical protein
MAFDSHRRRFADHMSHSPGLEYARKGIPVSKPQFALWFSVVSVILVLFGVVYVFFGLKILPVSRAVLLDWESALYGAIMMGWGVTLLLVGAGGGRRAAAGHPGAYDA